MGRTSRLKKDWKGILLWLLSALFTATCFVFHKAPSLRVYLTEECDKLTLPSQWRTYMLLLVNVAASMPTMAAEHFRPGLLAPSKATYRPGEHKFIGIETWSGFIQATCFRRILYGLLLVTPIPVFFLSNSLFFVALPVYNSYELLVSTSFFDGDPFDLTRLAMTRFPMREELTMPSRDLLWPDAYGGLGRLNRSLTDLQHNPTTWANLSRDECLEEFNKARYEDYRTLLLVTDFGQGNASVPRNNSALAVGILPGYRLTSASSSLVGLCPDAYLEAYPRAETPATAPLMPPTLDWRPFAFEYADPAEAEAWVTRNESLSKRRFVGFIEHTRSMTSDPMPRQDLCYQYWADADRWRDEDGVRTYMAPRADLKYCVAEPMEGHTCQVISSPTLLLVLAVIMSVMLCAMTGALFVRLREEGVHTCEEAEECMKDKALPLRSEEDGLDTCEEAEECLQWQKPTGWRGEGRARDFPWPSDLLYLALLIYVMVLWRTAGRPSNPRLRTTDQGDDGWLIKASFRYSLVHSFYEVVWFFHINTWKRRAQWKTKTLTHLPKWVGDLMGILPGLVKAMMHPAITLTFVHKLYIAMPLQSSPGTLEDGMYTSVTILGISRFNRTDNVSFSLFILFSWTVFAFLPAALLDGLLYFGTSLDMMEVGPSLWTLIHPLPWIADGIGNLIRYCWRREV